MSKTASFDVVSKVDLQAVDNAVNQTNREIAQRYDFKDSKAEVTWDRKAEIVISAETDHRLNAVVEMLKGKFARYGVSVRALQFGKVEPAAGGTVRQRAEVIQGISKEKGKEIAAAIKALKLKVQAQIMEDQVRVSGKSRDDLQAVIRALKEKDFGIELQFGNYR